MAGTVSSRLRPPTVAERTEAARVVASHLVPTPLLAVELPGPDGPQSGWLKLETAQPTGSFKLRGALAALASLPEGARAVSASAGNHGLGLCRAATMLGRPATVVVPVDASPAKLAALDRLAGRPGCPARVLRHGSGYEEAEARAAELVAADPDAVYVSAYSDAAVIAGQGTLVAEVEGQLRASGHDGAVEVVVPLGGGGLASGVGLAVAERPGWRLLAVEVEASLAVSAAVRAGALRTVEVGPSLADGLLGNLEAGSPTPAILGPLVDAGVAALAVVGESALRAAMRWAFAEQGLVVEGAGGAGLAAVAGAPPRRPSPVVVLSGRNVAAAAYAEVLAASD